MLICSSMIILYSVVRLRYSVWLLVWLSMILLYSGVSVVLRL